MFAFITPLLPYLRYAPWIVSGLSIVVALFFRGEYLSEKEARASDIAKANQLVLDQKTKEEALSRELETRHSQEIARLKEAYSGRIVSIMQAQNSNACIGSPPVNAFIDGLRRDSKTGPVQGKATK